ncbi:MAG: hypothetical protein Q8R32_03005 [bacterium]|nr:hypothetical protein [bacterium]
MRLPSLFRIHLPTRLRWSLAIAGVLFTTTGVATWTISLLRRETARANAPTQPGVEIPVLDRALLSELAGRVPR